MEQKSRVREECTEKTSRTQSMPIYIISLTSSISNDEEDEDGMCDVESNALVVEVEWLVVSWLLVDIIIMAVA